jgi:hypothetical protein
VVEDEGLVGVAVDEFDGGGEMALEDEDVVAQLEIAQSADAFVEVFAQDVARVELVLDEVAYGAEFGVAGEGFEASLDAGAVGEWNPTYYSADLRVLFCEAEEPGGLFQGLAGLYGDGALNAEVVHEGLQVFGQEVAADGLHLRRDPAVFGGAVFPEVMMGVDGHKGLLPMQMASLRVRW